MNKDVIGEIFFHLTWNGAQRVMFVCKEWRKLITNQLGSHDYLSTRQFNKCAWDAIKTFFPMNRCNVLSLNVDSVGLTKKRTFYLVLEIKYQWRSGFPKKRRLLARNKGPYRNGLMETFWQKYGRVFY